MLNKLMGLVKEEEGQGMTEYGLVLGIIAIAVVAILAALRTQIVTIYQNVLSAITGTTTTPASTTTTTP